MPEIKKGEWGSSLKLKLPTARRHYESEALLINEKARGFLGIMKYIAQRRPGGRPREKTSDRAAFILAREEEGGGR